MVHSCRVFLLFVVPGLVSATLLGGGGEKTKAEVVATLKGHSEPVYTVAFSGDGKYLVTGSFDNTLKLWEVGSGKELRTFGGPTGHQKMVLSVAFSPDGQMIGSGSVDNTLKIWDVPVSTPLKMLPGDAFDAVALSIDGLKLAAAGKDGVVRVWTPADGKELFKIDGHQGPVIDLSFSPKGDVLASCGADRMVRYWETGKGQLIAAVGAHGSAVNSVLIHPANNAVFSGGEDGLVKTWQFPPAPTRTLPAHGGPVTALMLAVDGNTVATASADKTVRISQFAGKEIRALTGPTAALTSVSLAGVVAAGDAEGKVHLWYSGDGKPAGQILAHGGPITSVNVNPPGNQVMTTGGTDGLVKFWAIPLAPQRNLAHPDGVLASSLTPDGKRLITGGVDKIVRSWDMSKLGVERQFTGHTGPVTAVALGGNGQILVSGSADATIRFWEQTKGAEIGALGGHTGAITALAINPAGNQMLSTSEDGSLKVWQLPFVAAKNLPHPDQVTSLVVSADGNKLVTGSGDKQVRVWNLANATKERDLPGPTMAVASVALSGDGKIVAGGSADKTVHLWNIGDGKALTKLDLPAGVQSVALNADGKLLAAGLADNSIKLLDPFEVKKEEKKDKKDEKKEAKSTAKDLAGHKAPVTSLAFSPKGDLLYSASGDKTIQAWAVADGAAKTKFEHVGPVAALSLSRDGTKLAAVAEKTVKVWNLGDGKELINFTTPGENKAISFSPDGTRLVVGGVDKTARLYGLDGQLVEFFGQDGAVQAVGFADAKRVVAGGADKQVRVWNSSLVWQKTQKEAFTTAQYTPKGEQVVSASADKTVRFWNSADGKELKSLQAHDGAVVGLSLSADATRLATAGGDKAVKVWNLAGKDAKDEKPLVTFVMPSVPSSIAMSPSGQRVAVATTVDKATLVRVLDVALQHVLQTIPEHTGDIKTLAFLGDNRTLFSGSLDKTARLTDVNVLTAIDAHAGGVVAAQYHGNGIQALTAGADKTVKLWDLNKAVVAKTFGPLPDAIRTASFNRDFTQVGAAAGKMVKVWNVADGKDVQTLTQPADVLSIAFSFDKTKFATGADDKLVRVFDLATGKELQFFAETDPVQALSFHPQNTNIVAGAGKETRVETISLVRTIAADGPVQSLALTSNGNSLLTGGSVPAVKDAKEPAANAVKVWSVANGQPEKLTFAAGKGTIRTIAAAKNGLLVAAAGDDQMVRVFNPGDGKEMMAVKMEAPVKALSFTPNSLALVGVAADKSFVTWGVAFTQNQPLPPDFLKPIQSFNATEPIRGLTIGADNATIYTAGAAKGLQVWKLASAAPTRNFPHPSLVDSVVFHSSGNLVASGCHDGKIRLFDLVKNAVVKEITAHVAKDATQIYAVAFSPDGKQIASGSFDGSMKLFDVTSGNLVREFKAYKVKEFEKGHQDPVYALAFSPDGKFLASGSGGLERVIKIWNVADGQVVRDLENPEIKVPPKQPVQSHPGWVYKLRFTKTGKLISAGDAPQNKGYLAVWNPQDGKMLYGEALPLGTFFGLAVSPDDSLLALGAGPRGAPRPELNSAYLLRVPELK